jgi:hypothetical protein
MTLTLEGHGDHYVKRVMQWCRGWVRMTRVASLSKGTIAASVSYLVFIFILVIVDPSPVKSPAEGKASLHFN